MGRGIGLSTTHGAGRYVVEVENEGAYHACVLTPQTMPVGGAVRPGGDLLFGRGRPLDVGNGQTHSVEMRPSDRPSSRINRSSRCSVQLFDKRLCLSSVAIFVTAPLEAALNVVPCPPSVCLSRAF